MTPEDIAFYKALGVIEYLIELADKQIEEAKQILRGDS